MVARLESVFRETGSVIRSPDMLLDREIRLLREVDCSIVNSTPTGTETISIECRRRSKNEDVLWIEQLACKRVALGLAATIAVSTKGFSKAARKKAEFHAITLKTYREVVPAIVNRPLAVNRLRTTTRPQSFAYEIYDDSVQPSKQLQEAADSLFEHATPSTPILREIGSLAVASYEQIVDKFLENLPLGPADESRRQIKLTFHRPTTLVGFPDETVLEALYLNIALATTETPANSVVFGTYRGDVGDAVSVARATIEIGNFIGGIEIAYQLMPVGDNSVS